MNCISSILALAAFPLLASAPAIAGNHAPGTLAPVSVQATSKLQRNACTPPSYDAACAALHRQLRREFSRREIGMLFGAAISYPELLTSYVRVNARYRALLRESGDTERVALAAR